MLLVPSKSGLILCYVLIFIPSQFSGLLNACYSGGKGAGGWGQMLSQELAGVWGKLLETLTIFQSRP